MWPAITEKVAKRGGCRVSGRPPGGKTIRPPPSAWAIDSLPIPYDKLRVWQFDKAPDTIELSPDGYEKTLREQLAADPMRIKHPSTKGISKDNYSFDDRAVLIYRRKKQAPVSPCPYCARIPGGRILLT